ncbi:MAG: HAD family hydrolase [Candidatus Kariarchaeaceae archaeon]|jgi:HAD superfamily hydrolase (TIGR01509 family)
MNQFSDVDTILFDMDGTLTDLGKRWWDPFFRAYKKLKPNYDEEEEAKKFEGSVGQIIKASGGRSRFLSLKVLWQVSRAMELNIVETYRFTKLIHNDPLAFKEIYPLEGAEEVINELDAKGYSLALVTSAGSKTVYEAREQFEFFKKFQTIITRNDVKKTKPHPESLLLACQRLNKQPSKCVMIGDFPQDIQASKAAGIKSIGVLGTNGKYTKDLLEQVKPDLIVSSIKDIPALFE